MELAFVGRQPIFTTEQSVFAYELLFRSGDQTAAVIEDGDQATASVLLGAFADIGLDPLVGGKRAFINLTRNLVLGRNLACLPPERVVLEILEDIGPDAEVIEALEELSDQGYMIALDDFVFHPDLQPLIELADVVKLEYPSVPANQLQQHVDHLRGSGVKTVLAEKIETRDEFQRCRDLGCDLFQGYFFCKPQVLSGRKVHSNVASLIRLVSELQSPEITTGRVEELIQTDPTLSYRLLRFVNSAGNATSRKIESLRQATTLMGIARLRSLASMLLLTSIDEKKPRELTNVAMIRAKMCETLAQLAGESRLDQYYTLGLFSVLDAMLDQPMAEVVELLPLAAEMNDALMGRGGPLGKVLDQVIKFEAGELPPEDGESFQRTSYAYCEALCWMAENACET